jgi:cellulose synthase/poly-beta-1,6-N-acetylglucosamine synthase-like glycosyltransferase
MPWFFLVCLLLNSMTLTYPQLYVDFHFCDSYCQVLSIAMYAIMIIISGVLAIQCACSLIYLVRWKRTIKRDDTRSKMIIMVPCYSEGDKELRKTIDRCV